MSDDIAAEARTLEAQIAALHRRRATALAARSFDTPAGFKKAFLTGAFVGLGATPFVLFAIVILMVGHALGGGIAHCGRRARGHHGGGSAMLSVPFGFGSFQNVNVHDSSARAPGV